MALPELFANNFTTTLGAAATAATTTITTAAAAPPALQGTGQFRIAVDSEYMLVTGGAATTTWTVTRGAEGSTAAAHLSGAAVQHELSAGAVAGLALLGSDGTVGGPLGSPLSSPSGVGLLEVSGNSYAGGGGADEGGVQYDMLDYAEKLALSLPARRMENRGLGGSISCWPEGSHLGGYAWHLQQLLRHGSPASVGVPAPAAHAVGDPYLPVSQVYVHHHALNDLAQLGSLNLRPMIEAHRTIWSRICAAVIHEDTDPAWVFTGTWAALANTATNSGPQLKYTTTVNDKATLTLLSDYPGSLVVAIGIFVNAGVAPSTIGVKVDGVSRPDVTVTPSAICDQASAGLHNGIVLRYGRGISGDPVLAAGAHTVELTLKSGPQLVIDYGQVESDPLDGPIIVVPGANRPLSYAQWNSFPHGPTAGTDPLNDASITTCNTQLQSLIAEFPGRCVFVDIDSALARNPAYFFTDNTHPNPRGHGKIAATIRDALAVSRLLTSRVLTSPAPQTAKAFWIPVGTMAPSLGPAFQNGWANSGGALPVTAFYRDLQGIVYVKGAVGGGTAVGNTIFTLPAGYRPGEPRDFGAMANNGVASNAAVVRAQNDGQVFFPVGGATNYSMFSFSFPAEQ